jgi:hypothetical protein
MDLTGDLPLGRVSGKVDPALSGWANACRASGSGEGDGSQVLPPSRVGLYVLPQSLHSMADIREARTKEKVGHSGRDD